MVWCFHLCSLKLWQLCHQLPHSDVWHFSILKRRAMSWPGYGRRKANRMLYDLSWNLSGTCLSYLLGWFPWYAPSLSRCWSWTHWKLADRGSNGQCLRSGNQDQRLPHEMRCPRILSVLVCSIFWAPSRMSNSNALGRPHGIHYSPCKTLDP